MNNKNKGRVSCKKIFLVYKNGERFIGTAEECAKYLNSKAGNIRKASNGGYIKNHFVKQILNVNIVYCIDTPDGKHYESTNAKDLQYVLWYAPKSILRYCYQNVTMKNGTKFYFKKISEDTEIPKERNYRK